MYLVFNEDPVMVHSPICWEVERKDEVNFKVYPVCVNIYRHPQALESAHVHILEKGVGFDVGSDDPRHAAVQLMWLTQQNFKALESIHK